MRVGKKNMPEIINAIGLGCGEPVVLAKHALEKNDEITVIVDTQIALENIKALGVHTGCIVDIVGELSDIYTIHLKKQ